MDWNNEINHDANNQEKGFTGVNLLALNDTPNANACNSGTNDLANGDHNLSLPSLKLSNKEQAETNHLLCSDPNPDDRVIFSELIYGGPGQGRYLRPVTQGEWNRRTHDDALHDTQRAVDNINGHSSADDRNRYARDLREALSHAEAHLSQQEFQQLLNGLPARTNNIVTRDDNGTLRVTVPYSLYSPLTFSNPIVYDSQNHRPVQYAHPPDHVGFGSL